MQPDPTGPHPTPHDLGDLVVVEFAGSVAGAHAAKLLGDLGAVVVCIEPDDGAAMRRDPAKWAAWATSRTTLRCDSPQCAAWLTRADVVIESRADGPLVAHPEVVPPDAVHVAISPFGPTGPYGGWRSADIVDQAIGGHLYLSGMPDREPLQGPTGQAALAAGVCAAIGTMAALLARRRGDRNAAGGLGQTVEVTHHEALAGLHQFTDVRYTHGGNVLRRMGNRYAGPGSPIGMYRAADGWIAFTVATAAHGEMLLAVTGLSHLLDLPGITSVTDVMLDPSILDPALNGWLAQHSVAEAVELLQSVRLAVAPVLTMRQLLDDEHLAARDWWHSAEVDGRTVRIPGPPFRIDGWPWSADGASGQGGGPGEGEAPAKAPVVLPPGAATNAAIAPAPPLQGIRVLDLTRVWAGPLAARALAELGADVVMVEAPWARGTKVAPPTYVAASHFYPNDEAGEQSWNRQGFVNKFAVDKRSLCLDIATAEGRAAFERLVASVDVVIENYSPRVMPNFGLGEDRLRALNPSLVYMTMPGYGRTGPARDYSAYGPVLDSHAGLSTLMGYPERDAWKCGIAWPDPVAGIHGALAVLVALWGRDRDLDRRGATVEVAQFETAVSMIGDRLVRAQIDDADPAILGNRHPEWAPQGVYRSAGDDGWLALTVPGDDEWLALCAVAALPPDWSSWTIEERRARHDEVDDALTAWSTTRTNLEAAAALQIAGIPAGHVADAADLINDPQLHARNFYAERTHPQAGTHSWARLPVRLSVSPAGARRPAPCLGEHNREVLREWAGLSDDEIAALEASGCVATEPPN